MTVVGTPADPGSRTLAGWWRQFADLQPLRIAFGPLPLVTLHALTRLRQACTIDSSESFLLRALSLRSNSTLTQLQELLLIPRPVLIGHLESLRMLGFVANQHDAWTLTPTGRKAVGGDDQVSVLYNRRAFTFVDARPHLPPQFLSVSDSEFASSRNLAPPENIADFVIALRTAVEATEQWKAKHRFPTEIEGIVWPTPQKPETNGELMQPAWRRLILVTNEPTPGVMVELPDEYRLYSLESEGYTLSHEHMLIQLPKQSNSDADLIATPTPESLADSWRNWCQARQFPSGDTISLRVSEHVLHVEAHATLRDRLTALGSDQWLLMDGVGMRLAFHIVPG